MICFENFLRPFAMFRPKTGFCVQNTNFLAVLHSFVIHRNWTQKHKTRLHRPRPATMMVDHFDVSHSFFSPFFFVRDFPTALRNFVLRPTVCVRLRIRPRPGWTAPGCAGIWIDSALKKGRKAYARFSPHTQVFLSFLFRPVTDFFSSKKKYFPHLPSLSHSHSHTRAWKKTFFLREITRGAPHTFQETIRAAG